MSKTNPARGMRDFLPADVRKREYVIGIIKSVYESYGFEPLETPAVENLETLTGKYGEEGNQLIFKILKRGEKLEDARQETRDESPDGSGLQSPVSSLADLALRYDLTVPLARVVGNHKNELPKFFKRYQIQPVWRADRPARGRFREFYQCDVDCIGSESIHVEIELVSSVSRILTELGFEDFTIRINHRDVLSGVLNAFGIEGHRQADALVAMDKLDKIGNDGVEKEFLERGLGGDSSSRLIEQLKFFSEDPLGSSLSPRSQEVVAEAMFFLGDIQRTKGMMPLSSPVINQLVSENGGNLRAAKNSGLVLSNLKAFWNLYEILDGNSTALIACNALRSIWRQTNELGLVDKVKIDPSLARGLSYYTGTIMEINVDGIGSLGGGGRYDGLIGMFGKEEIPACGFSLGLERILVVMEERGMFDKPIAEGKLNLDAADVLVTILSDETVAESLKLASELRANGLRVTLYPQADKEDKQWKYANSIKVPWICTVNDTDLADGMISFQDLRSREKFREPREKAIATISSQR